MGGGKKKEKKATETEEQKQKQKGDSLVEKQCILKQSKDTAWPMLCMCVLEMCTKDAKVLLML